MKVVFKSLDGLQKEEYMDFSGEPPIYYKRAFFPPLPIASWDPLDERVDAVTVGERLYQIEYQERGLVVYREVWRK